MGLWGRGVGEAIRSVRAGEYELVDRQRGHVAAGFVDIRAVLALSREQYGRQRLRQGSAVRGFWLLRQAGGRLESSGAFTCFCRKYFHGEASKVLQKKSPSQLTLPSKNHQHHRHSNSLYSSKTFSLSLPASSQPPHLHHP